MKAFRSHTLTFNLWIISCNINNIQLAGVAAIVIAAKKEESNAPKLDEVGRYTAGSCTDTAIRDQELHMLEVNIVVTQILRRFIVLFR